MLKIEDYTTFEIIKNNIEFELALWPNSKNKIDYSLSVYDLENEDVNIINIPDYIYFNNKKYNVTDIENDFFFFCDKVKKIKCNQTLLNKLNLLHFGDIILEKNLITSNVYNVKWINPDIKSLNFPIEINYLTTHNKVYSDILINKLNYTYKEGKYYK